MWDWELIKSGSSQGRYEVLVQYTHEDFHYAHAISYDTEQNEYCLHNHALYELVYCVRGDVIYQAEGVRYQLEPHSVLLAPALSVGMQALADRMVDDFVRVADQPG